MGNSPVAGDKRKRTQLTLNSLPHEVILSIVEWTAHITLEDQLEQERLEHERRHEGHHHHDHHEPQGDDHPAVGPGVFGGLFGGFGLDALPVPGQNANANANAPGIPQGIGDAGFMQNLFGIFGNGVPVANPPGVAHPTAPIVLPAAATVPPAVPHTQSNQDAGDTDDEMPRKTLQHITLYDSGV